MSKRKQGDGNDGGNENVQKDARRRNRCAGAPATTPSEGGGRVAAINDAAMDSNIPVAVPPTSQEVAAAEKRLAAVEAELVPLKQEQGQPGSPFFERTGAAHNALNVIVNSQEAHRHKRVPSSLSRPSQRSAKWSPRPRL